LRPALVFSADRVVWVPMGGLSPETLKVKDANVMVIGNFAQHFERNQIFVYSDQTETRFEY